MLSPARRATLALTVLATLLALVGPAAGRTAGAILYVSKSGGTGPPEGPPYCPKNNPCGSIVTAVGLAGPGDTISIGPGQFVEDFGVTISKNLTLIGKGPFGGTYVRSTLANTPVFTIKPGATVTISDLQIWKGAEGVSNAGDLTLDRVWVWENKGTLEAGGILNYSPHATLSLDRVVVAHNSTTNYQDGAAGGIENIEGTVTVSESTIDSNVGDPGGIGNSGKAKLTLKRSLVSANSAPADSHFLGTGGIDNSGTADLTNVTITGNVGKEVGGLENYGSGVDRAVTTLTNVTVAYNGAPNHKVPDHAGGIAVGGPGTITLWNTIVADNTGTDCYHSDGIVEGATDLVAGSCISGFPEPGQPFGDPRLLHLKQNGGPTSTLALRADSPAIDAGSNEHCPPTDQRGTKRPQDGNGDGKAVCDIGAYEFTPIHVHLPITPIQLKPKP